jgi:hypothetical protein
MIYAFTEAVASGCKPLALSPPLAPAELPAFMPAAVSIADEYGTAVDSDADFIVTRLFNPAFTEGKAVIIMAADSGVLGDYWDLKARRRLLDQRDLPQAERAREEREIAHAFGRLLGYSPKVVEELLKSPRF